MHLNGFYYKECTLEYDHLSSLMGDIELYRKIYIYAIPISQALAAGDKLESKIIAAIED